MPRICPHCCESIPLADCFDFDKSMNLICGLCEEVVFAVTVEADNALDSKKKKPYTSGYSSGYQGSHYHSHYQSNHQNNYQSNYQKQSLVNNQAVGYPVASHQTIQKEEDSGWDGFSS